MTRKDYVNFAAMLKENRAMAGSTKNATLITNATVNWIAEDMAHIFADDNPNFDRARFLAACGVKS